MSIQEFDLIVVGGGPSGLSAAINGASEGLKIVVLDQASWLGGQARESAAIENYPGFPHGITGQELMTALTMQARKFDAKFALPVRAVGIQQADGGALVTDEYGDLYRGRATILSLGLAYRRMDTPGLTDFMGAGVFYGLPIGRVPQHKCHVAVVGGANSAGQAVLNLARNQKATVSLLVRKRLTDQMSDYLVQRIRATENIQVLEECEVVTCLGRGKLEALDCMQAGQGLTLAVDGLFIFIGAMPRTYWLGGALDLDPKGFVRTWTDVVTGAGSGVALPYETSLPGVFAAGDVRLGSVKRIAAACGEGASALQMVHKRLGDAA